MTGGGNCVFSNSIYFPVPQQSQHCSGWGMHALLWLRLFAHTTKQLVELPKKRRALGAHCGCTEGLLPLQQGSCTEQGGISCEGVHLFQQSLPAVPGPWAMSVWGGHVCRTWQDVFTRCEDSERILGGHIHAAVASFHEVQPSPCFASCGWHVQRGKSPWRV